MEPIILTAHMRKILQPLAGALAEALPDEFAQFRAVAGEAAADAERLYKSYLLGGELPNGVSLKAPSKAARTAYRTSNGMLQWAIGNTSPAAQWVEEGTPERDMKACLATAPRARLAKATKKVPAHHYLIIPFRHATSDAKTNANGMTATGMRAMPKRIYALAKELERSMRVGTAHERVSATGYNVPAWTYEWQGRITAAALMDAGMDEESSRLFEGMVKMGKGSHSSYMTFRVMSQTSPASSWIRKAQPGIPALDTAIQQAFEANAGSLMCAFVEDVKALAGLS